MHRYRCGTYHCLQKLDSVYGLILQFKLKMGLFDNFPWFDSENVAS